MQVFRWIFSYKIFIVARNALQAKSSKSCLMCKHVIVVDTYPSDYQRMYVYASCMQSTKGHNCQPSNGIKIDIHQYVYKHMHLHAVEIRNELAVLYIVPNSNIFIACNNFFYISSEKLLHCRQRQSWNWNFYWLVYFLSF